MVPFMARMDTLSVEGRWHAIRGVHIAPDRGDHCTGGRHGPLGDEQSEQAHGEGHNSFFLLQLSIKLSRAWGLCPTLGSRASKFD